MKYHTEYKKREVLVFDELKTFEGWYIVDNLGNIIDGPYPTREAADIDAPSVIGG